MEASVMHVVLAKYISSYGDKIDISQFRKCMQYVRYNKSIHYKIINELIEIGMIKEINKRSIIFDIEKINSMINNKKIEDYCIFKTKEIKKINEPDWFT